MVLRRVHRVRQVRGETAAAAQGVGPNRRPCVQMGRHIRAGQQVDCSRTRVRPRYRQACSRYHRLGRELHRRYRRRRNDRHAHIQGDRGVVGVVSWRKRHRLVCCANSGRGRWRREGEAVDADGAGHRRACSIGD